MSGKLDQSLDEILSSRRTVGRGRGRGRGRRVATGRSAPVGGVQKNTTKVTGKAAGKTTTTTPAVGKDSKIIVSNLPSDVTEGQIKEYFGSNLGSVKKVSITYGPTGVSRGVATIMFSKPGTANSAAARLNGVLVDGRPMKVEVIVDASRAPPPEPVKDISERITKPKVQPKQAGTVKSTEGTKRGSTRGGRGGRVRRGRNAGRPKTKTAEELDAEMTDYFVGGNNANAGEAAGTTAASATNGTGSGGNAAAEDLGMDEIS